MDKTFNHNDSEKIVIQRRSKKFVENSFSKVYWICYLLFRFKINQWVIYFSQGSLEGNQFKQKHIFL